MSIIEQYKKQVEKSFAETLATIAQNEGAEGDEGDEAEMGQLGDLPEQGRRLI